MKVGVIGGSSVNERTYDLAYRVGKLIGERGWTLVNGGLSGVMEASARGAREAGGTVIGILPGPDERGKNPFVTHAIVTNMGHARNVIIAHTSDALIAVGGEYGTLSEIAIALKLGKKVVSLESWDIRGVIRASTPEEAVEAVAR
ncbi:MAG: TIGR00725 family protein [Deltaproteobacteria bacterium]|nr:MAG: TIGR00725 family protein [Deltaproteobacteria bacterium]